MASRHRTDTLNPFARAHGTMTAARAALWFVVVVLVLCSLSACSGSKVKKKHHAPGLMEPIADDFFIPANAFDAKGNRSAAPAPARQPWQQNATAVPFQPEVLVYFSPTSQAYFHKGNLDGGLNVVLWERFLKKYKFPYRILESPDDLEHAQSGVLVLASDVALSKREQQLITQFRQRGGSVFVSWLTGVRDASGAWQGFDYMESLLGIRVTGFTGPNKDQRYINPSGATAVSHSLPACQRIWTERAPGWFPLTVSGGRPAAQMLTWSRQLTTAQSHTAMAFDDTALADGQSSRMVFFGWPERLWMGADPQQNEALLYDSITWLLRRPDAYLATWPYPYSSAYMPVVYMADVFNDNDLPFAKFLNEQHLQASYFILGFEVDKSLAALKKIKALGDELAYEGDKYEAFKGQPLGEQQKRLQSMRAEISKNGLQMPASAGFYPPMDAVDANTTQVALGQPFLYQIVSMNASQNCIPDIQNGARSGTQEPLVLIPRISRGAEEMLEDFDEPEVVSRQAADLASVDQAGGISVARFANQSLLSKQTTHALINSALARKDHMWMTTGTKVAHWWLERARVSYEISGSAAAPELAITVTGQGVLNQDVAIWLNLPYRGARVQLSPIDGAPALRIATADPERAALLLRGLSPGRHAWSVRFVPPLASP